MFDLLVALIFVCGLAVVTIRAVSKVALFPPRPPLLTEDDPAWLDFASHAADFHSWEIDEPE